MSESEQDVLRDVVEVNAYVHMIGKITVFFSLTGYPQDGTTLMLSDVTFRDKLNQDNKPVRMLIPAMYAVELGIVQAPTS